MAIETPDNTSTNANGWHTIRPWLPPLTLTVREITSVSVTFILSAPTSSIGDREHLNSADDVSDIANVGAGSGSGSGARPRRYFDLTEYDHPTDEDNIDDGENVDDDDDSSSSTHDEPSTSSNGTTTNSPSLARTLPRKKLKSSSSNPNSIISLALSKGLQVDVDGSPWRMVIIRIDEKKDEAVIIIYGLMPGREYDIVIELIQVPAPGGTAEDENSSNRERIVKRERVVTEGMFLSPSQN
jgi:hypothetical protein